MQCCSNVCFDILSYAVLIPNLVVSLTLTIDPDHVCIRCSLVRGSSGHNWPFEVTLKRASSKLKFRTHSRRHLREISDFFIGGIMCMSNSLHSETLRLFEKLEHPKDNLLSFSLFLPPCNYSLLTSSSRFSFTELRFFIPLPVYRFSLSIGLSK